MLARQSRPWLGMPRASIQAGSIRTMSISLSVCGFSRKPATRPLSSTRMMPMLRAVSPVDRHAGDRHVGLRGLVRGHHFAEIHAVKLVAREDQHVLESGCSI